MNVFLIVHRAGLCLFDTGQTARAAAPGYFPWWHPFFRLARFELTPDDEAPAQVARLGHDPADVRWVVLSHLHTDHAGGMAGFAGAEIVVTRQEWQHAFGLSGRVRGYLPQRWPHTPAVRLVEFGGDPVGPFRGSTDLAGDGQLVLVPTPRHTSGHMGLLVRIEKRRYLLAGDLVESSAELDRAAPEIARYCRSEAVVALTAHDPRACDLASGHPPARLTEAG